MIPPISIGPSTTNPYGVDGYWTAFPLQIGSNSKVFDVLVSTSQALDYLVLTLGCGSSAACAASRGGVFNPGSSNSWNYVHREASTSQFFIPTDSELIGEHVIADFGYDVTGLGYDSYTGYGKHLIGTMTNYQLWLGLMGIMPLPASVPGTKNLSNSIIQDLKNQSRIPSISWGYTGGAYYQLDSGVLGSLTLGGYDKNRFTENKVSFPMDTSGDYGRYLSVYIQSIKATNKTVTNHQMLSETIYAALDSTVSYIYLPLDACKEIEDTFGLEYNNKTEFYYITEANRQKLLTQKHPLPSITFTISPEMGGGPSVDINLPYPAFDLLLTPPYIVEKPTHYFPIKRAYNDSVYTLGRTFFQEAYVIADFERNKFSVSQAYFAVNQGQHLVPIAAVENVTITHPQKSGGSSTNAGVIAGPVVAVVVILILAVLGFWLWRRRRNQKRAAESDEKDLPAYSDHIAEMDGYGVIRRPEKTNTELEATESGRATPVPTEQDALHHKQAPGSSPLASAAMGAETSPNIQSPLSEMDATATMPSTYFELPGSMAAQRRSMGPHEMNATAQTPGVDTEEMSANQTSGPLPDLPEPSPPLESSTITSNPLTSGMETVPPPPPPK